MLFRASDAKLFPTSNDPSTVQVQLPNGMSIHSIRTVLLHLPPLPSPLLIYVFSDHDLSSSLLSVSQLCNHGCNATFTNKSFSITYNNVILCSGLKLFSDTLWHVPLSSLHSHHLPLTLSPSTSLSPAPLIHPSAAATISLSSDKQFVQFVHAALGCPVLSTFIAATKAGYLSSWPRLSSTLILAHPPFTLATAQGHLNQHRQGLDSTSLSSLPPPPSLPVAASPPLSPSNIETPLPLPPPTLAEANRVYIRRVHLPHTVSSDMTGRFPISSDTGSQYVLISEMDGYIHAEPMASRTHTDYVRAFKRIVAFFSALGRHPFFQRLDNETSAAVETYLRSENISLQYCPPGQHRANTAERSIQTFKAHAIATFANTPPDFPIQLWDRLLPQIELCLNHLHPYKLNPAISAYAGFHGSSHDFRAHPIAPAGTRVLIHDKPSARGSWSPHGVAGFYLGPALQHYRCYTVWATATSSVRVTDTLAWLPHLVTMPSCTPHDTALAAIHDLTAALISLSKMAPTLRHARQPSSPETITTQLHDLLNLFSPPPLPPPPHSNDTPLLPSLEQRVLQSPPLLLNPSDPVLPPSPPPPSPHRHLITAPTLPSLTHPEQRVSPTTTPTTQSTAACITTLQSAPPPSTMSPPPTPDISSPTPTPLNLSPDGSPLTYKNAKLGADAPHWLLAESEEFTRLFASNTLRPLHAHEQPITRRADTTYYNPKTKQKRDPSGNITYRIRGTAGGDRINYDGPTAAFTAAMPAIKLLIHSVISDNAHWMTIDIKDYYLNTPLLRPEYVRIPLRFIPSATITLHSLTPYITNSSILFEINKGMYGLPQSGLLAQQRLVKHLSVHGYTETSTPCLFRHHSTGTVFALVVDDFGIKYTTREGADHLIRTLNLLYDIKIDWVGRTYVGFTITFDPLLRTVALSMPGYINKILKRFNISPSARASTPAVYTPPSYGNPSQKPACDTTAPLDPDDIKTLQEQVGSLLYYARSVDPTILPAVTTISSLQSKPTKAVAAAMTRLLHYCAAYPDNSIVFHACDMRLVIQSDASYLSRPNARSVAGGVFYLLNKDTSLKHNGPCHAISSLIPVVVASVAEAEYAALFINGREGAMLRTILNNLGYPQPSTPMYCDNACAVGIATDTITPKRTKSIDMNFHWIRDRVRQSFFTVNWRKGSDNLADFFTKPLSIPIHRAHMPFLVHTPLSSITSSSAHAFRRLHYLTDSNV